MKNNDALKKNHFWILLGLVPLLVLIAVFMISSGVGGAIDARQAAIDKAKADIGKVSTPKSDILLEEADKNMKKVADKKGELWQKNWERQKGLYVWPNIDKLKAVERMNLKFGAPIPDDDFTYDAFKRPEVYLAQFSTAAVPSTAKDKIPAGTVGMAEMVAPTQFNGGWQRVLRHVADKGWGTQQINSAQIWLAMEDIWVQRSLLDAVRSVNADMAEFTRVKYEKNGAVIDDPASRTQVNPLARKFKSRTWEVELEVLDLPVDVNDLPVDAKDAKGGRTKRFLTGRLINTTDRLQLLGLGNTMVLNVWLEAGKGGDVKGIRPFEFRIGGEFIPGKGITRTFKDKDGKEQTVPANVLQIIPTKDHIIRETMNVREIVKVEQVFDSRTVPIKRIEALALGKTDSRYAGLGNQLKMPEKGVFESFVPKEGDASSGGTDTGAGGSSLGAPPGGGNVGSALGPPPMGGMGDSSSGTTTPTNAGKLAGGGTIDAVIDGNRKRYIDVTPNVRRMPVGIVVVVDQSQMQDVLLAFANSPLRFQITQVTWARFRGSLGGTSGGAGGTGGSTGMEDIVNSGPGNTGEEFRPPSLSGTGVGGPTVPGMGSSLGPPPGMGSAAGPPGMGMGTGPNPYNPYSPTGGNLTTVSESQLTSGLIELSVYGVVSLYEKYTPPEAAEAEKKEQDAKDKEIKDGKGTKETDPVPADPKDKDPKGEDPMVTDPKGAKMRRRVRS